MEVKVDIQTFECCQSSGKHRTGIVHIQSYNFKGHSLTMLSVQK